MFCVHNREEFIKNNIEDENKRSGRQNLGVR